MKSIGSTAGRLQERRGIYGWAYDPSILINTLFSALFHRPRGSRGVTVRGMNEEKEKPALMPLRVFTLYVVGATRRACLRGPHRPPWACLQRPIPGWMRPAGLCTAALRRAIPQRWHAKPF